MRYIKPILATGLFTLAVTGASAAPITPISGSTSTQLTASVPEQATIVFPATAAFNVSDVSADTTSQDLTITATNIVLADGKKLRLSLVTTQTAFDVTGAAGNVVAPPVSDITWNTTGWSNGTGAAGPLATTQSTVVTSATNAADLSNTAFAFTIGHDAKFDRAGDYTVTANWVVESV